MLSFVILFIFLIVLGIAAIRWGVNSSDGPDSEEWERRAQRARASAVEEIQPVVYMTEEAEFAFDEPRLVHASDERQPVRELCSQC